MPIEDQITKLMDMLKILAKKQSSGELQDEIENLNEEKENSMAYCQFKNDNFLEKILNNPGLQHLAENIFDNLNFEDLVVCQEINQSSKEILEYLMDKPIFLLTKFRNLSKENEKDWINVIQSTKSPKKEKNISAYLKWNLKREGFQHLAENVVDNLNFESLGISQEINQSSTIIQLLKYLMAKPIFLLKKFRSLSLENESS